MIAETFDVNVNSTAWSVASHSIWGQVKNQSSKSLALCWYHFTGINNSESVCVCVFYDTVMLYKHPLEQQRGTI